MKFVRKIRNGLAVVGYMAAIPFILAIPRSRRKVVLGAWYGDMFSDNPKYLGLYLSKSHLADCVWIGKPHLRAVVMAAGLKFAERGSLLALWHSLTAKWFAFCIAPELDIGTIPNCGRARLLNLWHGISYKRIGRNQGGHVLEPVETSVSFLHQLYRSLSRVVYGYVFPCRMMTSVSCEKMAEIMEDSWPSWFKKEDILYAGMPRNDIMVRSRSDVSISKEKKRVLAEKFGWPKGKKWFLYMPTWRGASRSFSFLQIEARQTLQDVLRSQNAVLIEKQHHFVLKDLVGGSTAQPDNIIIMSKEQSDNIDVQELLLAADRLITDYSSCFFDYELTGRPVIHFAYDREKYENSLAGVNYKLDDISAGPIAKSEKELLQCLLWDDAKLLGMRGKNADEPLMLEKGTACKFIAKYMGLDV